MAGFFRELDSGVSFTNGHSNGKNGHEEVTSFSKMQTQQISKKWDS